MAWQEKNQGNRQICFVCLFVAVVCSIQQVKFCSADGLVGGKGTCSMVM